MGDRQGFEVAGKRRLASTAEKCPQQAKEGDHAKDDGLLAHLA